jgi:hypothetical protein
MSINIQSQGETQIPLFEHLYQKNQIHPLYLDSGPYPYAMSLTNSSLKSLPI